MHEKKCCARCDNVFECKAGTIAQCQCYAVKLTLEERIYIEEKFADCLCSACLQELKNEYNIFKEKFIFG
jgi:hypothetical protein